MGVFFLDSNLIPAQIRFRCRFILLETVADTSVWKTDEKLLYFNHSGIFLESQYAVNSHLISSTNPPSLPKSFFTFQLS